MRSNRNLLLIALGLVLAAWVPMNFVRVQNLAKEEEEYIRRVWGQHTVGQTFHVSNPLDALEIQVRATENLNVPVIVTMEDGTQLADTTISAGPRDSWVTVPFSTNVPAGNHTITFSAPTVPDQNGALLIRYQPDSTRYEDGQMVVDGEESYGDIAFRTHVRTSAWRAVLLRLLVTDKSSQSAAGVLLIGVIIAIAIVGTTILPARYRLVVGIAALMLFAVVIRAPYTRSIEGVFGGDAFNYYSKTNALMHGQDPFASDPRKAPLYSFLLIPGLYVNDPLLWSRWVGIVASAVIAGITPLLAKRFGAAWPVALGAGALVAVNVELIWEAPSGLANTTFAALIVVLAWAYAEYVHSKASIWAWLIAIASGLTVLTRYEGVLFVLPICIAALFVQKLSWKKYTALVATAGILIALPFSSYVWSGTSGVRTLSDIQEDEGLSLIHSGDDIADNISRMHGFFSNVWVQTDGLTPLILPLLIGIVLMLFIEFGIPRIKYSSSYTHIVLAVATALYLFLLIAAKHPSGRHLLIALLMAAVGAGATLCLKRQPKIAIPIIIGGVALTVFILGILPKSRYFIQLIPFMGIAMTLAAGRIFSSAKSTFHIGSVLVVSIVAAYVLTSGHTTLAGRLETYNADAHEDAVMLKALQFLRSDHGRVGYFASSAGNPTFIYIPDDRRFGFTEEGAENERTWLLKNKIKYLIERPGGPLWKSVTAYPNAFTVAHLFDSIYGESTVTVYKVLPEKLR